MCAMPPAKRNPWRHGCPYPTPEDDKAPMNKAQPKWPAYSGRAARLPLPRRAIWLPALLPALLLALLLALWGTPLRATERTYVVDAGASRLLLLVQRRGVVAVLAHDHVLVARDLLGTVRLDAEDAARSTLTLAIPVAALEVDPPEARAQAGMSGELTPSNREAVRENLLAPGQLDAEEYPRVTVASSRVEGRLPDLVIEARVKIRGREQELRVPVTVTVSDTELVATGQADLMQSDFGIVPYTTLFGAIAVEDRVHVQFRLVARPAAR
jgi:polyisoprenoid-binding protein YceI